MLPVESIFSTCPSDFQALLFSLISPKLAGIYKVGNGGMTSFGRAILAEFKGDIALEKTVKELR